MNKILAAIVIGLNLIIIFVSVLIYNNDFQHKSDVRSFYQTSNRIDNKSDFDYLLKTGSGRSIVQTELSAIDSVTLPQVTSGKKFMALTATYQRYQPHTELLVMAKEKVILKLGRVLFGVGTMWVKIVKYHRI